MTDAEKLLLDLLATPELRLAIGMDVVPLPSPRDSEAPAIQFDPLQGGCSGCGRPEGIAHAHGCPVLADEETKP